MFKIGDQTASKHVEIVDNVLAWIAPKCTSSKHPPKAEQPKTKKELRDGEENMKSSKLLKYWRI